MDTFSEIYDSYVVRIYRFIFLKVSSPEIAEDLCSEVFVHFLNEFKRSDIENIQAFLYGIARNKIADYYRANSKSQVTSLEVEKELPDQSNVEIGQAMASIDMDRVRKALKGLSDDSQNLIIWRYLDELSIQEIAQISGKSEVGVRVGIHRALQVLKEKMNG